MLLWLCLFRHLHYTMSFSLSLLFCVILFYNLPHNLYRNGNVNVTKLLKFIKREVILCYAIEITYWICYNNKKYDKILVE